MCNKSRFKNPTVVDTSKFAKNVDLESLNSEVDMLDIGKLETTPVALNSDFHLPKKFVLFISICFTYFNERPSKMIKNAFYFILKAFFVLMIFNVLS